MGAGDVREALAGVHFSGDLEMAYRVCLWSRLASRVLWPLASFKAEDEAALYAGVQDVDWSLHLAEGATLAVDAGTWHSHLNHSHFLAQRVKDAVVDQCRQADGTRPWVDTSEPDVRINLRLHRNHATVSLDLAGLPLHRRGWRVLSGAAPLKENLAAAVLLRADWPAIYAGGGMLLDPMCGSGTLLIEAALMVADVAPGVARTYYGFLGWKGHDSAIWRRLMDEAQQRAQTGLRLLRPAFSGSDVDAQALSLARRHAQMAGVAGFLTLSKCDVKHVEPPRDVSSGLVVTNPPYGVRLSDQESLPLLYRSLGDVLRTRFSGWKAVVLTAHSAAGKLLALRPRKRYTLYNGALETQLLIFDLYATSSAARVPVSLSPGALMLRNRLEKNVRHRRRQAQREGIGCWRCYDQDLPEYAVAIDVYVDLDGCEYLHIQEYRAPPSVSALTARTRLHEVLGAVGAVFDLPPSRMVLKTRQRGKGGSRYGVLDQSGEFIKVSESGLAFYINLRDYLDTGLFPDHRLVRMKLRDLASGRRFLNLFAYTATASVYAAAGGAYATTSVDLSATYLDWASRNLALNGFNGRRHRLIQADARIFLQGESCQYDLIFVDPPTFSNSKRAADFDVQRDHVALLQACGEHLAPDGVIVFSNNFRRFKFNHEALKKYFVIEDWTRPSIPFDFAQRASIHGCWLLRPHHCTDMIIDAPD